MTKMVAVCNCSSGVMHTYMARNALLGVAKKRGIEMHVETQGTLGIEFNLTKEQIAEAEVVIWTTDLRIRGTNRFEGKPLLHKYSASGVIKHTDQLLDAALALIESDKPA
ncbi:MAG TPA: fructose PTS transporter subunit IIB [Anaerolineae bacterium]|nr:fructose PTS transporter subunit IIB [Anaerolineae bacterium]